MMIFETILFSIFCYVFSSIIVQQKIFEEPRGWLKQCSAESPSWVEKKLCQLISCMFCTGFWSAIFITTMLGFMPLSSIGVGYILHGFLGAFSSYLLHLLAGLLIKKAESLGIDT